MEYTDLSFEPGPATGWFELKLFHSASFEPDKLSGSFQVYDLQIHYVGVSKSMQTYRTDSLKKLINLCTKKKYFEKKVKWISTATFISTYRF